VRRDERFIVTTAPLDVAAYLSWVSDPACGATALFTGTVRSPNAGEAVAHIDYEGYEAMLETQMRSLAAELRAEYDLGPLVVAHRLGRLAPGEASICVVVASAHRRDALAACQRGIDRAKELLPVWKREVTGAGARWVAGSSAAGTVLDEA
jgi:MoaE-MoaD fusion protein